MNKYLVVLLVSLLMTTEKGLAQSDSMTQVKSSYLGLSIGFSHQKFKDQIVSPVQYEGTPFAFGLRYARSRPKSHSNFYIHGVIGSLKAQDFPSENRQARFRPPEAQFYRFELGYLYLYHLTDFNQGKWKFDLGGNFYSLTSVRFSERWDNSAINYDQAFVLGVTGRISRKWTLFKKPIIFAYQLGLPVVAFVMRPPFTGVPDFLDHETGFLNDAFQNGQFTSIHRFPHIKSTLEASWEIAAKNIIKISYQWDYYSYPDPLPVQAAGHTVFLTLLTKLK